MKFFNNVGIRRKVLVSFGVVIIFAAILSIIGIVNIYQVDNQYTDNINTSLKILAYNEEIITNFQDLRRSASELIIYTAQPDKYSKTYESIGGYYNTIKNTINSYKDFLLNAGIANATKPDGMMGSVDNYMRIIESINSSILAGDRVAAEAMMESDGKTYADQAQQLFNNAFEEVVQTTQASSDNSTALTQQTILLIGLLALVILIVSLILAILLTRSITKPIYELVDGAKNMAVGKLDFNIAINNRDEIGELAGSMAVVMETVNRLIDSIHGVIDDFREQGDIDARLDPNMFQGSYRYLATGINELMDDQANDNLDAMQCIYQYAEGNFDVIAKRHVGKKSDTDVIWDRMQHNLKDFFKDITDLVNAATAGQLDMRIDASKYNNNWADMAEGLNRVLDGVIMPVNETIQVVEAMSKGDLSVSIQGHYQGEFAVMKASINHTLSTISTYIHEITHVLSEMSNQNFDLEVINDYIGDFAPIKTWLNKIIEVFNEVLTEINLTAGQVASGARYISESSMSLAQGATQQASAVQELSSTIETITDQTRSNAENANQADSLAKVAKESAAIGSSEMNALQNAMREINNASSNISKIIKVIDDIAFQTNLLALNAAIEAAGAGRYGKGFAVVATEVGTLASRSKNAASETTSLIQSTIDKVNEGTRIANQTANTLETIVGQITDITQLVGDVANASVKQEEAIKQVNTGIDQISQVTQANTATSEEEASSAQQLSSQSEVFKSMVGQFRLRSESRSKTIQPVETLGMHASKEASYNTPVHQKPASEYTVKKMPISEPRTGQKPVGAAATHRVTAAQKPAVLPKPAMAAPKKAEAISKSVAKPVIKPDAAKPIAKPATTSTIVKSTVAKPDLKPAVTVTKGKDIKPASAKNSAPPLIRKTNMAIPEGSGASVYNRKDFGKY